MTLTVPNVTALLIHEVKQFSSDFDASSFDYPDKQSTDDDLNLELESDESDIEGQKEGEESDSEIQKKKAKKNKIESDESE